MKRKKEQKRKWQQKYLQKLGVDPKELFDDDDDVPMRKELEKMQEKIQERVPEKKPVKK